jgi:disulfide bond formation protein DsbB
MARLAWALNAILVLILCAVLCGALYVQLSWHEEPCPLCLLQRVGMIGVAVGALLNLRCGTQMGHYGLAILSAVAGGTVALLQTGSLAVEGKSFGTPVFGLHLYTWSFLVFASCIAGIGLLLLLEPFPAADVKRRGRAVVWILGGLLLAITLTNVVLTARQCGLGLCWG